MKPFMLKLTQGKDASARTIYANMNQVCTIEPGVDAGSVLTFAAVVGDEPAYILVNETPDQIGARPEWNYA